MPDDHKCSGEVYCALCDQPRLVWLTREFFDRIVSDVDAEDALRWLFHQWDAAPADPHGAALSYIRNHADPRTDRDFVDTVLRALGMPNG